jgi:hypothetical protein
MFICPPSMNASGEFYITDSMGVTREHTFQEIAAAQQDGWQLEVVVPQDRVSR